LEWRSRKRVTFKKFKCGPKNNSVSIGSSLKVRSPFGEKCQKMS
jgi:hypothetical protein